jgi:hypothetical protein
MTTVVRYPELRAIHTRLFGVTFRNPDGSRRQELIRRCRPGDGLTLVREPDNPHDPCAIAACTAEGQKIGYVGYHQSRELAAEIDAGRKVTCEIVRVTGGGGWLCFRRRYGVNVRIVIA